ncbi:MAG: hypothetical protein AAGC60_26305 [Acidobacteriota bacterium]
MKSFFHVLSIVGFALTVLVLASSVDAQIISGPEQIEFVEEVGTTTVFFGDPQQTVDGVVNAADSNGYAYAPLGVLFTFNFDQPYDLTALLFAGQVGSSPSEMVEDFEITFFADLDGGGLQVGPVFAGTHTTPNALESFDLSGLDLGAVRSFTFVATSRFDGSPTDNTEFSEIQFQGTPTPVTAVPTLGQWGLGALTLLLLLSALSMIQRLQS